MTPLWVAQVVTRNRADRPCEKHSEETTVTTDNRTNEPTPELVTISYHKDGKDYLLSMPSDHAEWAEEMLNSDRAAQGAAPQAESVQPWNDPSDPNSPQFDSPWEKAAALIKSIRCAQWDMPERRDQEDVRDEIYGLIDRLDELVTTMLAAPALPSSGVDEDKLAEVIGKARTTSVRDSDGVKSVVMESNEQIARAVAEWLKGRGNAARE